MPRERASHDLDDAVRGRSARAVVDGLSAAGATLDHGSSPEAAYAAWASVAHAAAEFEPITVVVDPTAVARARRMLSGGIEIVEAPLDDFRMRDIGPTFELDDDGALGAVDWIFNGWGAPEWSTWENDREIARFVAGEAIVPVVSSLLVNEGGAIHVDGEGTVIVTETVQLDPGRNPYADKERVEAELARTIGASHVIWLPRGLTRYYKDFGTRGHVDMFAAIPSPGTLMVHQQPDPEHPDHAVMRELRATRPVASGRSSICRRRTRSATTRASSTGTMSTTSSSTAG